MSVVCIIVTLNHRVCLCGANSSITNRQLIGQTNWLLFVPSDTSSSRGQSWLLLLWTANKVSSVQFVHANSTWLAANNNDDNHNNRECWILGEQIRAKFECLDETLSCCCFDLLRLSVLFWLETFESTKIFDFKVRTSNWLFWANKTQNLGPQNWVATLKG